MNFGNWLHKRENYYVRENVGNIYRAYHGGSWDGKKPLRLNGRGALGIGAYFTPDKSRAVEYAKEHVNGNVVEVEIEFQNPLVFNFNVIYGPVDALIALGMDKDEANELVEKVEERYGYLGLQIKNRALSQGYDGLIQMKKDDRSQIAEIVIWDRSKIKRILSVEPI